jgi:hypothetical protein
VEFPASQERVWYRHNCISFRYAGVCASADASLCRTAFSRSQAIWCSRKSAQIFGVHLNHGSPYVTLTISPPVAFLMFV